MDEYKVLIVEDDRMLSAIFQMFIRELGHKLLGLVTDGESALELCAKEQPDIVLMDIHIKGDKNGVETARELSKLYDLPVVYITGDYEESTVVDSLLDNTYGFLAKPLYKSTLGVAIEFAIHKHRCDVLQRSSRPV